MVARFHYEDLVYKQLLADELPADKQQSIASHIEHCAACQSKLESLSQSGVTWDEVHELLSGDQLTKRLDASETTIEDSHDQLRLNFLEPSEHNDSLGRYGRYEIKEVLGRGGMGIVMRGHDVALNRYSAIKVLAPEFAANASARKRFSREAKSAAAVVHEHVIPILTVDEAQGLPYLVMPVVEGRSLEQRVNESGPLDTKETLRVGMQIASGLAAAHAQGLVHRDVKPANILLENGVERVMITDFGLARAVDDASMTRSGVIAGTPQYMSPEQARGNEVDFRSDLFSLGSVLYFMCTGHSPFRAETTMGVLHRIVNDQPRSVRAVNPEVPEWLEQIIMKLLEKAPSDRYESAEELSDVLGEWLAHLQSPEQVAQPQTAADSGNGGRHGWLKYLGGMAAAIVFLSVIVLEMNKGTLEIKSAADVNLRIKRNGEVFKTIKVSQGNKTTRIAAGEYVIEVDSDSDAIEIDKNVVTLRRGESETVQISLRTASESAEDEKPPAAALVRERNSSDGGSNPGEQPAAPNSTEESEFNTPDTVVSRTGDPSPGSASLEIKISKWRSDCYLDVIPQGGGGLKREQYELAGDESGVRIIEGLVPGKYQVSLMRNAGPRIVRLAIAKVELKAKTTVRIEFPTPKGFRISGSVTGMAARGLTTASFTLHRKDDQWEKKSMAYIGADDAVGVAQDGDFQTDPLTEGWYEWSLDAFQPDRGEPFRFARYRMTGEVYVPAGSQPKKLEIQIPARFEPDREKEKAMLSNPDSKKLQFAIDQIREKLIEHNEVEFSSLVSTGSIRPAVMRYINSERAKMLTAPKDDFEEKSRAYFKKHVEPILLEMVAGGYQISLGFEVWYTGHSTKGQRARMSLPLTASRGDIARDGFVRDGIVVRLEVATPDGDFPAHAFHVMELKGLTESQFGEEFPREPDEEISGQDPESDGDSVEATEVEPPADLEATTPIVLGRVTDAKTGKPITDFNIAAFKYHADRPDLKDFVRGRHRGEAISKKSGDGSFSVTARMTDYVYDIQVDALGYQTIRTNNQYRVGGEQEFLDVVLQPAKRFRGRVLNPEGKPIESARVYVTDPVQPLDLGLFNGGRGVYEEGMAKHLSGNYRVVTDEKGSFEVCSAIEDYTVVVICEDGYAEVKRERDEAPGDITVQAWAKVSCILTRAGEPLPSWSVYFEDVRDDGPGQPNIQHSFSGLSLTDEDGRFEIRHVPPQRFRLTPSYNVVDRNERAPDDVKSIELDLKPGEHRDVELEIRAR